MKNQEFFHLENGNRVGLINVHIKFLKTFKKKQKCENVKKILKKRLPKFEINPAITVSHLSSVGFLSNYSATNKTKRFFETGKSSK